MVFEISKTVFESINKEYLGLKLFHSIYCLFSMIALMPLYNGNIQDSIGALLAMQYLGRLVSFQQSNILDDYCPFSKPLSWRMCPFSNPLFWRISTLLAIQCLGGLVPFQQSITLEDQCPFSNPMSGRISAPLAIECLGGLVPFQQSSFWEDQCPFSNPVSGRISDRLTIQYLGGLLEPFQHDIILMDY